MGGGDAAGGEEGAEGALGGVDGSDHAWIKVDLNVVRTSP